MKKANEYQFHHRSNGTIMQVRWDSRIKEWYGENGKFDFSRKTAKEVKAMLKKWDYKI
jgi:hypothetical protein